MPTGWLFLKNSRRLAGGSGSWQGYLVPANCLLLLPPATYLLTVLAYFWANKPWFQSYDQPGKPG